MIGSFRNRRKKKDNNYRKERREEERIILSYVDCMFIRENRDNEIDLPLHYVFFFPLLH